MSMMHNHKLIGGIRLVPIFLNTASGVDSDNTYTPTPSPAVTDGNFLFMTAGGTQSRTIITPPTGFTTINPIGAGTATNFAFRKIASSEPANYTIVWSGALGGGWNFMELVNVDNLNPIDFHVGNSASTVTTISPAPSGFNVTMPGIAITYISKSATSSWTPDNGFTAFGGTGEHKIAYKLYSGAALSQNVNWSGSSESVTAELIFIRGKQIN